MARFPMPMAWDPGSGRVHRPQSLYGQNGDIVALGFAGAKLADLHLEALHQIVGPCPSSIDNLLKPLSPKSPRVDEKASVTPSV